MSIRLRRGFSSLLGMGLAVIVGLALLTSTAHATVQVFDSTNALQSGSAATMQQLENGWYIEINNGFDIKKFSGFSGYSSTGTDNNGAAIAGIGAGSLTVTGIDNQNLSPGPGLKFSGNFTAMGQGTGSQAGTQDTSFNYSVTVLQPSNYSIEDIGLQMGASAVGYQSGGEIKILESVTSPFTQATTDLMRNAGVVTGTTFDMALVTPVATTLSVFKDVFLQGGDNASSATQSGTTSITDFNQTFSQVVVPEPSTMAIAGLGALGMIGYGLRRRKALGA